jgi:hypothetical protein
VFSPGRPDESAKMPEILAIKGLEESESLLGSAGVRLEFA